MRCSHPLQAPPWRRLASAALLFAALLPPLGSLSGCKARSAAPAEDAAGATAHLGSPRMRSTLPAQTSTSLGAREPDAGGVGVSPGGSSAAGPLGQVAGSSTDAGDSPEVARVACPSAAERLEQAARAFDDQRFDVALSCAEDELLDDPDSATAQQARGAALAALGRGDEARLAYVHALALDPDDPQILTEAADLYLTRGNGSREFDELALAYARRGEKRARRRRPELLGQLALLQGMALNDLGRSSEAVGKLEEAVGRDPDDLDAHYEHAVALFELCRFPAARAELQQVLAKLPDDAYAHHELGLTLERLDPPRAAAELERATALDPQAFPATLPVSAADFQQLVAEAVRALPDPLKRDLAQVQLGVEEMPDLTDLTVDDPPLSPTILGLFRGEPLPPDEGTGTTPLPNEAPPSRRPSSTAESKSEPRAILLYRRNLARVAHSRDELARQVQVTLWHELGHLRGADDDQLRLRGLE